MSRRKVFPTTVDRFTRSRNAPLWKLAREIGISPGTLLKVRALNMDRDRGRIHWTTLVLIGAHMGLFNHNEIVTMDDSRLLKLAPRTLCSNRGRGAPGWYSFR